MQSSGVKFLRPPKCPSSRPSHQEAFDHMFQNLRSNFRFGSFLPTCFPKKKIAFLKTHKCASSTVQNILFRFGEAHGLKFVLPLSGNYLGRSQHFERRMVETAPWHHLGYDIFAMHTMWNTTEVRASLGQSTDIFVISIIRDPVDLFESLYSFAQWDRLFRMDITKFAQVINFKTNRSTDFLPVGGYTGHNQMLHDFGLPDPNTSDISMVKAKIREIEQDFDLIMVAEQMDESLVLLKNMLCWNLQDVSSLPLNERQDHFRRELAPETRMLLRQWLWADQMLYDYFLYVFNLKKMQFGENLLQAETSKLKALNMEIKKDCSVTEGNYKTLKADFKPSSIRVKGFFVSNRSQECMRLARSELAYIDILRLKQSHMAESNKSIQQRNEHINIHENSGFLHTDVKNCIKDKRDEIN
ncbi:hypothetical protein B566_EDAN007307 [Ephemera danica]|nr:hypothetical protein B566_EDAN007307 [Ephemera danica]